MRWPEIEQGPRRLLVVPVGSLEQHGPHLPLDTDTRIAVAVARRACAGRPGVALAPAFAIGASGEHAAFPGTLSIGAEALTACLIELGRHASLHWPALLLVNGHGGNVPAVEAAIGRLRYEGRACASWHAGLPGGDAHAGRSETSVMLALDPDAVRLAEAGRGDVRPLSEIMPMLREQGVRAVSANGVLGDPAGACAAEGERLLTRLAAGLDDALNALLGTRLLHYCGNPVTALLQEGPVIAGSRGCREGRRRTRASPRGCRARGRRPRPGRRRMPAARSRSPA
jgi:mycofactocin system creatininase family protein